MYSVLIFPPQHGKYTTAHAHLHWSPVSMPFFNNIHCCYPALQVSQRRYSYIRVTYYTEQKSPWGGAFVEEKGKWVWMWGFSEDISECAMVIFTQYLRCHGTYINVI